MTALADTEGMILLVGGSRDGRWVDDNGLPEYQCSVATARPGSAMPIADPVFSRERYTRQGVNCPGEHLTIVDVSFYVHEDLSFASAMRRLMAHYQPPKGKQG